MKLIKDAKEWFFYPENSYKCKYEIYKNRLN